MRNNMTMTFLGAPPGHGGGGGGGAWPEASHHPNPPGVRYNKSYKTKQLSWFSGVDLLERVCFNFHFPECAFQTAVMIYMAVVKTTANRNRLRGKTASIAAAALYISCKYHDIGLRTLQTRLSYLFDISRKELWHAEKITRLHCKKTFPLIYRKVAAAGGGGGGAGGDSSVVEDESGRELSNMLNNVGRQQQQQQQQQQQDFEMYRLSHAGIENVTLLCIDLAKQYSCRYVTLLASVGCLLGRTRFKILTARRRKLLFLPAAATADQADFLWQRHRRRSRQRRLKLRRTAEESKVDVADYLPPAPSLKKYAHAVGASTNSVSRQISKMCAKTATNVIENIKRICANDRMFIHSGSSEVKTSSSMAQAQIQHARMQQQQQQQQQHQHQQQQKLHPDLATINPDDLFSDVFNTNTQQHVSSSQSPLSPREVVAADPDCVFTNNAVIDLEPEFSGKKSWEQDPANPPKRQGPLYNIKDDLQVFCYANVLCDKNEPETKMPIRRVHIRKKYIPKGGGGETRFLHLDIRPDNVSSFLRAATSVGTMAAKQPNITLDEYLALSKEMIVEVANKDDGTGAGGGAKRKYYGSGGGGGSSGGSSSSSSFKRSNKK